MTVCPIAIVAGCRKCPAFGVCPLKSVLGDQPPPGAPAPDAKASTKASTERAGSGKGKRRRG